MLSKELDRVSGKEFAILPPGAKVEILSVEKPSFAYSVYGSLLSLMTTGITTVIPITLLEYCVMPGAYSVNTVSTVVAAAGTLAGTMYFNRLFNAGATKEALNSKYGEGVSQSYKLKHFRRTLFTKEILLPIEEGRKDSKRNELLQVKVVTDKGGFRVELIEQENPLALWDKHASLVRKVHGIKIQKFHKRKN